MFLISIKLSALIMLSIYLISLCCYMFKYSICCACVVYDLKSCILYTNIFNNECAKCVCTLMCLILRELLRGFKVFQRVVLKVYNISTSRTKKTTTQTVANTSTTRGARTNKSTTRDVRTKNSTAQNLRRKKAQLAARGRRKAQLAARGRRKAQLAVPGRRKTQLNRSFIRFI